MKAIIVAGGKGERLRPLTTSIPKPMVRIAGKPILEHIIDLFKKEGIADFIITLCYLPDKITSYFGDGRKFGIKIQYLYEEENSPLGTAGNITKARNLIDSSFIVTYADILRELNIRDMRNFHERKKSFATVNVYKRFGKDPKSMVFFDESNKITKFIERPDDSAISDNFVWANGAFYIFEPEIFNYILPNTITDFGKDIFPMLLKQKKDLYAFPTNKFIIDIGNMNKLEQAKKNILALQ